MARLLGRWPWSIRGLDERFPVWHMFGCGYFVVGYGNVPERHIVHRTQDKGPPDVYFEIDDEL